MFLVLETDYLSKKSKEELDVMVLALRLLLSNVWVGEPSMQLPIVLHWTRTTRTNGEKKIHDYAYISTALLSGHLPERLNI